MSSSDDWLQNETLFRKECKTGQLGERIVASVLKNSGLEVDLGKRSIRDDVSDRHKYKNQKDLWVEGEVVEVKSRDIWFTRPNNFPYSSIFIDTVSGWDQKDPEPIAVLCLSQKTDFIIALPVDHSKPWQTKVKHDQVRDIKDKFYLCSRSKWYSLSVFIQDLKNKG